ncbi:MAG: hypothetical protein ACOYXW_07430 [Actinomycetota bacterium]
MTANEELEAVARAVDTLRRSVAGLRGRLGATVDVERIEDDALRLESDVNLLRRSLDIARTTPRDAGEIVYVPDRDYDPSLWSDAEDEGLGSRGRQ